MQLPVTWFARSVLHFAASLAFAFGAMAQSSSESLSLLTTDNAYNPIPSPDGRYVAYVRTGWGEQANFSFGRSSLVSDVKIMSVEGAATPRTLAKEYFLSGWTPDSTQVVCYRDWRYALVTTEGKQVMVGRLPNDPNKHPASEWVAYAPSLATIVWSRVIDSQGVIETPSRTLVTEELFADRVVPSPDGRHLAIFGQFPQTSLRVYDLRLKSWTDLGRISIHPDKDWWYIQPHWNPWFADSSRLVFLRDSSLVITTPDGSQKTEINIDGPAGLPVPSPSGIYCLCYLRAASEAGASRPAILGRNDDPRGCGYPWVEGSHSYPQESR